MLHLVSEAFARGQRALIYPGVFAKSRVLRVPPGDALVLWRNLPGTKPVEAWLLPALGEHPGPRPLVVYVHGNGEVIDEWPQALRPYRELGYAVLLPEYRGYGCSGGAPSRDNLVSDIVYFVREAQRVLALDTARLVFHGRSLGGGVLAAALGELSPQAFVLESTFASLEGVVRDMGLPASLLVEKYPSELALASYTGRVLILHGYHDRLVRYAHAERLRRAARGAELLAFECGHNDMPRGREYWQSVSSLLAQ